MTFPIDLTGAQFGRLLVVSRSPTRRGKEKRIAWECLCACGKHCLVTTNQLRQGATSSCGCLREYTNNAIRGVHGNARKSRTTAEYRAWSGMKRRCYNPNNSQYKHYGGRGITVCPRWVNNFSHFLEDIGKKAPGTSLDRIDNNGNYEPANCRWATAVMQNRNRRTSTNVLYCGSVLTLKQIATQECVNYHRLYYLTKVRGLSVELAVERLKAHHTKHSRYLVRS